MALAVEWWRIAPAQPVLVDPRRRRPDRSGTVVPRDFCGDGLEHRAGGRCFSPGAAIDPLGLCDIQCRGDRGISGDLFRLHIRTEPAVRLAYRWGYWRDSFPPWEQPWKLPAWLFLMHTGNMMSYPIGGANGASFATFALVAVGILAFWRRGQRTTLGLLLSPLAMGLAASGLGQYPYGGTARVMLYAAPSICVLAGCGGAALLSRMRSPALSGRSLRLAGALLALLGFYFIVTDLIRPYRTIEDHQNRRFARWFWSEYGRDADLLCARCDLGLIFQPTGCAHRHERFIPLQSKNLRSPTRRNAAAGPRDFGCRGPAGAARLLRPGPGGRAIVRTVVRRNQHIVSDRQTIGVCGKPRLASRRQEPVRGRGVHPHGEARSTHPIG